MPSTVFISHTKSDKALADAWRALFSEVFGEKIEAAYSSRSDGGPGAIQKGADWFQWIAEQVTKGEAALVLLTPMSVQKPWLMWEAGAVFGAAFAGQTPGAPNPAKVFPVIDRLRTAEIPSPLQSVGRVARESLPFFYGSGEMTR